MPREATVSRRRPYSKAELRAIADELVSVYQDAERTILEELAKGALTDWGTAFRQQQLSQIHAALAQLDDATQEWVQHWIPTLYEYGLQIVDDHLAPGGMSYAAHPGEVTPMDLGMTRMHREAISILSENVALSLGDANSYCGQRIDDMVGRARRMVQVGARSEEAAWAEQMSIRDASLRTMQQAFAQGKTAKQAKQMMLRSLDERGITSFVDNAGKEWDLSRYAEMVTRTVSQEAQRHGTQNRLMERGYDLVKVDRHGGACEKCARWEGKVLSLTGANDQYPTMDEAFAAGLFHPDCAHAVLPHIGGKRITEEDAEKADGPGVRGVAAEGGDGGRKDTDEAGEPGWPPEEESKEIRSRVARGYYDDLMEDVRANPGAFAGAEHEERMRKLGVEADLRGIPRSVADEMVARFETLAEHYPEAMKDWRSFGADPELEHLDDGQWLVHGDGRMYWNHRLLGKDPATIDGLLDDGVKRNEHPSGCGNVSAMASHEFGHAVEDAVKRRIGEDAWKSLDEKLRDCGVSGYTDRNPNECFAEAFMARHHGDGGTPRATRAGEMVAETLKSLGMWAG